MKKLFSIIISVSVLLASFTAAHCESGIKVMLDGQEIAFDVPPQIIDDRTLVPMRAIFEALGAEVEWSQELQTVKAEKDDTFITMTIGANVFTVGNLTDSISEKIELDVPPQIIDDRTLVPIRAVSETFDCDVKWDSDAKEVIITSLPEPTAVPAATASPEPAAAPSAEPAPSPVSQYSIKYDDTEERKASYMRDFQILSIDKNDSGDYVVTFKLRTFLEGRGTVSVSFNCLDKDGKVVDNFGGMYVGTDYTWSWQEDTVTISSDTAEIQFILNK